MTQTPQHIGKVILAGAGPGDPELLSIKAARYLSQADVVLTDRLVSAEILETYVNPSAEIVYVGKQGGRGTSTKQSAINEMLIEYAQKHKLVVRLKGGDVSFFSNVLDELETLVSNNIPYEIVPGITAAAGASAYAGIPLTARDHATGVRFITFHKEEIYTETYWKELAESDDTLVFYMSVETLATAVQKLLAHKIAPEKLLAVVEQATTPLQNVHVCSLYEFEEKLATKKFISPSLVIIGKVVGLHSSFGWMPNNEKKEHYFQPIAKLSTVLTDQPEKVKQYAGRA